MKYPARKRKKKARRDPKINRLFCPPVSEFVPSPYFWFSANPAISFAFDWNLLLSAPQIGQFQSSGRLCAMQNWYCGQGLKLCKGPPLTASI
jgi:hypothetical protein